MRTMTRVCSAVAPETAELTADRGGERNRFRVRALVFAGCLFCYKRTLPPGNSLQLGPAVGLISPGALGGAAVWWGDTVKTSKRAVVAQPLLPRGPGGSCLLFHVKTL